MHSAVRLLPSSTPTVMAECTGGSGKGLPSTVWGSAATPERLSTLESGWAMRRRGAASTAFPRYAMSVNAPCGLHIAGRCKVQSDCVCVPQVTLLWQWLGLWPCCGFGCPHAAQLLLESHQCEWVYVYICASELCLAVSSACLLQSKKGSVALHILVHNMGTENEVYP